MDGPGRGLDSTVTMSANAGGITMPRTALVTLTIGPDYQDLFRRIAEPSWRQYAARFGYDMVVISTPLDNSPRALGRSPAWQKCLVGSEPWASDYDRIVWVDCDIVINNATAPDIARTVPSGLVGGVTTLSLPPVVSALRQQNLGPTYYSDYGLPCDFEAIFNTGVLVYEPTTHAKLFKHVYDAYEERDGNWHYEQRPLSWHIVDSGLAHSIDSRFNKIWAHDLFDFYPFLLIPTLPDRTEWIRRCMAISIAKGYFFHFAGHKEYMEYYPVEAHERPAAAGHAVRP